jgi:hypothetical protein
MLSGRLVRGLRGGVDNRQEDHIRAQVQLSEFCLGRDIITKNPNKFPGMKDSIKEILWWLWWL